MEPEYIAQTGEPSNSDEREAWIRLCVDEAKVKGCTFSRASFDEKRNLVLFEGWKEWPDDQGEPRWQMTAASVANTGNQKARA